MKLEALFWTSSRFRNPDVVLIEDVLLRTAAIGALDPSYSIALRNAGRDALEALGRIELDLERKEDDGDED